MLYFVFSSDLSLSWVRVDGGCFEGCVVDCLVVVDAELPAAAVFGV